PLRAVAYFGENRVCGDGALKSNHPLPKPRPVLGFRTGQFARPSPRDGIELAEKPTSAAPRARCAKRGLLGMSMSHQHRRCDRSDEILWQLGEVWQRVLTRPMLHNAGCRPVLAGLDVPIERAVGEVMLIGEAVGDAFVSEPHDRRDLDSRTLKTFLLAMRL